MARDASYWSGLARQLKNFWWTRNSRILEWMSLESLVDANAQSNTLSYVTNEPQIIVSLASHLLTAQPLRHRILVSKESEQKKAGETERALVSWWREIDEEYSASGLGSSWMQSLAWWMCSTGWYAIAARMDTNNDGTPDPIAEILNPLEVFPQYTAQHMQAVSHIYKTTMADIQEKAELWGTKGTLRLSPEELENPYKNMTLIDYWYKPSVEAPAHNVVVVEGQSAVSTLKPEEETYLQDIPILVGPVGGTPYRGHFDNNSLTWQRDAGRSILEPNRKTIEQLNLWMSFLTEVAREAAQPPLVATGMNLTQQDMKRPPRAGSSIISTKSKDAAIKRIEPNRFPVEIQTIVNILDAEKQRGGFPYVLYGGTNVDLSGFAINQLLSAATKLIGPQRAAMQKVIASIDRVWLESYRQYDYPAITIAGKSASEKPTWFMEDFDSTRIPKYIFVETEIKLDLPSDLMNRVQILRTALGNNAQIIDLLTGLEEILKVEDPYGVMERIKEDMVTMSQEGNTLRIWEGVRDQAKAYREMGGADNRKVADTLDEFAAYLLAQMPFNQQAQGQAAQKRGLGIPPQVQPPEASGRSPDLMRQMLGLPPAGANVGKGGA